MPQHNVNQKKWPLTQPDALRQFFSNLDNAIKGVSGGQVSAHDHALGAMLIDTCLSSGVDMAAPFTIPALLEKLHRAGYIYSNTTLYNHIRLLQGKAKYSVQMIERITPQCEETSTFGRPPAYYQFVSYRELLDNLQTLTTQALQAAACTNAGCLQFSAIADDTILRAYQYWHDRLHCLLLEVASTDTTSVLVQDSFNNVSEYRQARARAIVGEGKDVLFSKEHNAALRGLRLPRREWANLLGVTRSYFTQIRRRASLKTVISYGYFYVNENDK